jgi:hypothetical protein
MDELLDSRRKRSKALVDLEEWSAEAKQRATPAASTLTDQDVNLLVHEAR